MLLRGCSLARDYEFTITCTSKLTTTRPTHLSPGSLFKWYTIETATGIQMVFTPTSPVMKAGASKSHKRSSVEVTGQSELASGADGDALGADGSGSSLRCDSDDRQDALTPDVSGTDAPPGGGGDPWGLTSPSPPGALGWVVNPPPWGPLPGVGWGCQVVSAPPPRASRGLSRSPPRRRTPPCRRVQDTGGWVDKVSASFISIL